MAGVIYTMDGVPIQNTLHFQRVGATPADAQELANDLVAGWEANVMPFLSVKLKLNSVIVVDQQAEGSTVAFSPPAGTGVGGEGGESLPNETAFCISFHTARRGRSYRGRIYIPGISEASRDGTNRVQALFATNMRIGIQNTLFGSIGTTWIPCVLSRYFAGALRPLGVLTPITEIGFTDLVLDSQRRRKPSA